MKRELEIQQVITVAVASAFEKERGASRPRINDDRRSLSQYPPTMSVLQVKTFLGCSFQHVINLYDSGALSGSNTAAPGKQRLIKFQRSEVAAFIERRKGQGRATVKP